MPSNDRSLLGTPPLWSAWRSASSQFFCVSALLASGVLLPAPAQRNGSSISRIAALFAAVGVVLLLLHLAAAVLGLVGVLVPRRPRPAAGAALGIGATGPTTALADIVVPALVGAALTP